jgi:hypothetical protein
MLHLADTISLAAGSIGPSIHGSGSGPHSGPLIIGLVLVVLVALLVWSLVDG